MHRLKIGFFEAENDREEIAEHLKEMPPIYRATYKKAVAGKSLRAAVNSFCAECVMWQREEVRLCTSLSCQLWPYRPYRDKPKKTDKPEISSKVFNQICNQTDIQTENLQISKDGIYQQWRNRVKKTIKNFGVFSMS